MVWLLLAFLVILVALVALFAWLWTPDAPNGRLEARYLNAPSDYLEAAGLRLHVRDTGSKDAPALILLHGVGSSLHSWEPWARSLSADFRVVRYDLPGFGLTGPDVTGDYSEARGMQVLEALMDKLSIDRASLIGNSMGGRLAWRFAAEHPMRTDKLVLISPDGFERPGNAYGQTPVVPVLARLLKYTLPRPLLRKQLALSYGDRTRLSEKTVTQYHDLMLARGVRGAMLERAAQTILDDPRPLLRSITAPALVVWGEMDALIPLSRAGCFAEALPAATLVTLPGLGHMPHEEDPDVPLAPVREFLNAPKLHAPEYAPGR